MNHVPSLSVLLLPLLTAPVLAAAPETGTIRVDCNGDAKCGIAECYSVPTHSFEYKLTLRHDLRHSGVKVYDLTFPSPVKTDILENNTVHAELFLPAGEGPFPACIVLDILQGNAVISRSQALWLAQHGVAGMVVHMAHYGPRRPSGSTTRLISTDIPKTIAGVRQTVQDIRCAVAWLAGRPEFDSEKLGLVGTSLGSLVGAVAAANEPRIKSVCLMLGGGGLVDAYYDHPRARQYLPLVELLGGKAAMKALINTIDPLTYANLLKDKKVLMVCASRDDIVPPSAAKALWEATGKQKIVWIDSTHVGAALHTMTMLTEMTEHIRGMK
jgi:cephalosporin-C deacetylase-like acetyl esterase